MADDREPARARSTPLDDELAALIQRRAGLAQKIGALKGGAPAYRPEREAEILNRSLKRKGSCPPSAWPRCSARSSRPAARSRSRSASPTSAREGTFSEQAVRKHFGRAVEALPAASIDEAFRRCESGAAQFTVVPVENSTEGAVGRTLDLLLATPLQDLRRGRAARPAEPALSHGERPVVDQENLLARAVARAVQRLACAAPPAAERVPVTSQRRGGAAAPPRRPGAAAIAGEAAAERYGLDMLARAIEDDPNNTTRFLVLGNIDPAPTGKDRTSLVLSAENKPGAVHALLTPLAQHRVSMTRIESRPRGAIGAVGIRVLHRRRRPPAGRRRCQARWPSSSARAPYLKVLGSYPIASKLKC